MSAEGAVVARLGTADDVGPAVSVYERSNLARRGDNWPNRAPRIAQVRDRLRHPETWFFVAFDGLTPVAMAVAQPLRADDGAGAVVHGASFLNLIFVAPQRWGQGIGGLVLDAMIGEAVRRGYGSMQLWTEEADNERAQRLYRSRGFSPTGRRWIHEDALIGEWEARLPSTISLSGR